MSIDFSSIECQQQTNEAVFGICDDQNNSKPAYLNVDKPDTWVAKVTNPTKEGITFIAVDNCIDIRRKDGSLESRCDGILY
jgi:hypothetical protein